MSGDLIRWTMTDNTRSVLLSALSEAAERKREAIEACGDCHDGTCDSCAWRAHMAEEYDAAAEIVAETYEGEPACTCTVPDCPDPVHQDLAAEDDEPEPDGSDPECDDQGGMSEYRYVWPGDPSHEAGA